MNNIESLICEKWPLNIDVSHFKPGERCICKTYFWWALNKRSDLSYNAACDEQMAEVIGSVESVAEYFGGLGTSGLIFQNVLKPKQHFINDYDEACCEHLKTIFGDSVEVTQFDVYKKVGELVAEFVSFDFNLWTLKHHLRDKKGFLDIWEDKREVKWLHVTDSAIPKLHLNKSLYSKLSGVNIHTPEDYFKAYQIPGFGLRWVLYYSHCAYLLFQRDYNETPEIKSLDSDRFKNYGFQLTN